MTLVLIAAALLAVTTVAYLPVTAGSRPREHVGEGWRRVERWHRARDRSQEAGTVRTLEGRYLR
jgi:hypothetical protein